MGMFQSLTKQPEWMIIKLIIYINLTVESQGWNLINHMAWGCLKINHSIWLCEHYLFWNIALFLQNLFIKAVQKVQVFSKVSTFWLCCWYLRCSYSVTHISSPSPVISGQLSLAQTCCGEKHRSSCLHKLDLAFAYLPSSAYASNAFAPFIPLTDTPMSQTHGCLYTAGPHICLRSLCYDV